MWNYSSFWFWAHAQGYVVDPTTGGKISFGLDMGNGFEHGSSETYEDSVILSGRLHKLKVVRRIITDEAWTFSTDGDQTAPGTLSAEFTPEKTQSKEENFVVIKTSFNQVFGVFKGWFIDEKSRVI